MSERTLPEQRLGLEALRNDLIAAGARGVGNVSQKRGEPNLLHLPVSRRREVVYAIGDYDLWGPKHPIRWDLSRADVVKELIRR